MREEVGDIPREARATSRCRPQTAYQLVHDELLLDGNAAAEPGHVRHTWMEPQARPADGRVLDKNMIDKDEYPQTAEIETPLRATSSADLWNAPDPRPR